MANSYPSCCLLFAVDRKVFEKMHSSLIFLLYVYFVAPCFIFCLFLVNCITQCSEMKSALQCSSAASGNLDLWENVQRSAADCCHWILFVFNFLLTCEVRKSWVNSALWLLFYCPRLKREKQKYWTWRGLKELVKMFCEERKFTFMMKLMHSNDEMGGNISPNLSCKLCVKMDIYFTKFMFEVMNMMKEFPAEFRSFLFKIYDCKVFPL